METSLVGTWMGITNGVESVPLTVTFAADGSYVATQTLPSHPSHNTSDAAVPLFDEDGTYIATQSIVYISADAVPEPPSDRDERTREETVYGTYAIAANRIEARLDVPGANEPTVEQLVFALEGDTLTLRDPYYVIMTLRRVP